MEEQQNPGSARLKQLARMGQWVAAISGLLIVGYCIVLAFWPAEAIAVMMKEIPGVTTLPATPVLVLSAVVAAIPALVFVLALYQAWHFFEEVRRGEHYGPASQARLKSLGRLAIGAAVAGVGCRTVLGLLLSSANPPGQKMLVIGLGSGELSAIVIGILVFVFANIMREAAALAQENKSFI